MEPTIRTPGLDDAEAVGRMHHAAWREAYTHLLPSDVWAGDEDRKIAMWRRSLSTPGYDMIARVAARDGEVVGLAAVGPSDSDAAPPARDRCLRVLYVLASGHGSGLGARLVEAVLPSSSPAELWVFERNPRARAFYAKHGFAPDGARHVFGPELGDQAEIRMIR